jgi:single-stranded DNA-binding protein
LKKKTEKKRKKEEKEGKTLWITVVIYSVLCVGE